MDTKIIGNVYASYDYDKFRILLGNRDVSSLNKIRKSIDEVGQLMIPIIVNEKYEIIDGQHRFRAWSERNFPIYFIVCEGYGIRECIAMNTTSSNWKLENYISSFAQYGDPNYIALNKFEEEYSDKLKRSVIRAVASGTVSESPTKAIQRGTFKLAKSQEEIEKELSFLALFDIPKSIRGNTQLLFVIIRFCYECPKIDNAKLLKQFEKCNYQISGITDIKSAAEAIEKIYNYQCSKKSYIYIATEYREYARQKSAAIPGAGKSSWDK